MFQEDVDAGIIYRQVEIDPEEVQSLYYTINIHQNIYILKCFLTEIHYCQTLK